MRKILASLIMFSVLVSACKAGGPSTQLDVELNDFAIIPDQFTVPAGSDVDISVTNNGIVEHNFNIMKYGIDIGDKFDEEDHVNVLWELEVQPGETKTETFTVPDQPGIFQIVCAMPGHVQSGMLGTLEVVK